MKKEKQKKEIRLGEKICYGLGDFGGNMGALFVSTYIMLFFTDAMGIPAATAGTIAFIALIWDAINDPLIGTLADRHTTKLGTYRPWILASAVPAGLFVAMLFFCPNMSTGGRIAWAIIAYIMMDLAGTCAAMPYGAMSTVMTQDDKTRISLGAWRDWGANLGGFIISGMAVDLISGFGDGTMTDPHGYFMTAVIVGVVIAICYILCGLGTKERIKPQINTEGVFKNIGSMLKNKQAVAVLLLGFFINFFVAFKGVFTTYYAIYYLGDENFITIILIVLSVLPLFVVPFVPMLVGKFGRKKMFYFSGICAILCGVTSLLAGHNTVLIIVSSVFSGLTLSGTLANIWGATPDVAEYGAWKTGVFCPGVIYACMSLMIKIGAAFSSYASGWILSLAGFDANPVGAANAIYLWYGIVPIVAGIIAILIIRPFSITPEIMDQVHAELQSRGQETVAAPAAEA